MKCSSWLIVVISTHHDVVLCQAGERQLAPAADAHLPPMSSPTCRAGATRW